MKKNILLIAALLGAMTWTGCVKEEPLPEEPEVLRASADSVWTLTLQAVKQDAPETKGLAIEGEEATTTALISIWKADEPVKVFLETDCIGILTAAPDNEDAHKATLSGTVITTNLEANVSTITLLTPRESWDYTGQEGMLLETAGSIEKMYHYTAATGILVTAVDTEHGTITTENATFTSQQSIYRMNFRYLNPGSTKLPITAKSVTITSAGGQLVQSRTMAGVETKGPITVTLGTASANPFFVALRNGDETNEEETLSFTVIDADGITYKGTKTIPAAYKPNGKFVSMKNATLNERLGVTLSATEVSTVW